MADPLGGSLSEAVKARDEALAKAAKNMRVMVTRLEELIDAPFDKEVAAAVALRIGVKHLSKSDVESQVGVTERYFQRWCHEYFITATNRVFMGERMEPAHVTTHYPSPETGAYLKFFLHKIREDFIKVNRDHVGDLLFRMALLVWRQSSTLPTDRDKKQMFQVLYGEGEEGWFRRIAAETQGTELTTRFTEFEDVTKARFWSVVAVPEDVRDFFERLSRKQRTQKGSKRVGKEYFFEQIRAFADGLRIARRFDVPRFTESFREYKQLFTDFVLNPDLEMHYALPIMKGRRKCGMQSKSIAKRAGDNRDRFEQLYELAHAEDEAEQSVTS